MPSITFTFTLPLSKSLQVGDKAYYSTISEVGGFDKSTSFQEIGTVTAVSQFNGTHSIVECDISSSTPQPSVGAFIFYSKDNSVNQAKAKGYYGVARFQNSAGVAVDPVNDLVELYAVSAEIFSSSK